jgi:peptidyl-dipeptidase Dcp
MSFKNYIFLLVNSCSTFILQAQSNPLSPSNPFSSASKLFYQAPPFDKIKNEHYKPALEAGIQQMLVEIQQIVDNPSAANFENTLVALEKSGQLFSRTQNVFSMVSGANTNDTLQNLAVEIAPKMTALNDAIFLNDKLFARIKSIDDNRKQLHLAAESERLLDYYYKKCLMSGALLNESEKKQIKKLNEEEATLAARFSNQLLAAGKNGALAVNDAALLKGLSEAEIAKAKSAAGARGLKDKWLLSLRNTTQQPALSSLENRSTRQQLFEASWNRAKKNDSTDTRSTLLKIATIRAEKAKILGFPNYASWALQDQMATTPAAVDSIFAKLAPASLNKAKTEATAIQTLIDKQNGGFKLEAWDWDFYAEQVRKEKYNLDEKEVRPYFDMYKVLEQGVFYAANVMYGLTFKERKDIPVYHPDVRVYEVFDNGKSLALFYADYYKRDNKNGGAWMSNAVGQSYLLGTKPVIYNVCNFPKPLEGEPSLISFTDVTTMFHEFGHTLHGLFASQKYPTLSGANTARDFVEFPSQFNEHWALEPQILANYAKHYKTGKPIEPQLVEKIKNAATFNKGYAQTEAIAAASLDLEWHKLSYEEVKAVTDVDSFEQKALTHVGLNVSYVPPRYRSSYFSHIWGGGYAAGYYAYQWTKMLEEEAYVWFKNNGGMTRKNGDRFRKIVLSRGNTENYNEMFRKLVDHSPNVIPMIDELGLLKK